jgi:uncharacterized protein YyaL (SSP411 family)
MLGEVRRVSVSEFPAEDISQERLDISFESFVKTFDNVNGGFGGKPKFPPAMSLEFLLAYYKRTGNKNALEMVRKTCDKMARGGIYDQLGGGFHRYTVDAIWLTPSSFGNVRNCLRPDYREGGSFRRRDDGKVCQEHLSRHLGF